MQWIDGVLSKGNKVDFFHDEFRCPVFVKDVVAVILALTEKWVTGEELHLQHSFLILKKKCMFSAVLSVIFLSLVTRKPV